MRLVNDRLYNRADLYRRVPHSYPAQLPKNGLERLGTDT